MNATIKGTLAFFIVAGSIVMAVPDMKARIVEQGFMPVTMGVGETEKFVNADVERWGKIIRDGNIKAE